MEIKFHLALPCRDIGETRTFYRDVIRAGLGRSAEKWLDVDLFGNQLTFTESGSFNFEYYGYRLEDHILPSFHFGAIVPLDIWNSLYSRLLGLDLEMGAKATFMKERSGEHLSFFVKDPNGYMVEFKSFKNSAQIFST